MAKDAKGHGSDGRGGSYPNIDKNLRGPGKHTGYGGGMVWHVQKSNGAASNWYSAHSLDNGDVLSGQGLGAISAKLSAAQPLPRMGEGRVAAIARQHGISTDHLTGNSEQGGVGFHGEVRGIKPL